MDEKTAYWIGRYKIEVEPIEGHSPTLSNGRGRGGQTVTGGCSCGQWDMKFTGCNEAGVCYAMHDAIAGWKKHAETSRT